MPPLEVEWLGRVSYSDALNRQLDALSARATGEVPDRLLLLEHPPVITLGRSAKPENVLVSPSELERRGIEVHEIGRGGDVTYHAPGQLVGYLIVDLRAHGEPDVHRFMRDVESALMDALHEFGVGSHRVEGMTGVYVGSSSARPRAKIASIGIGVKRWTTYHGFALNVTTDLDGFSAIVPCGLEDVRMTSLEFELGRGGEDLFLDARDAVDRAFRARFGSSEQ